MNYILMFLSPFRGLECPKHTGNAKTTHKKNLTFPNINFIHYFREEKPISFSKYQFKLLQSNVRLILLISFSFSMEF